MHACRWDRAVGDGDCGLTFHKGATAVLAALDAKNADTRLADPIALFQLLGQVW